MLKDQMNMRIFLAYLLIVQVFWLAKMIDSEVFMVFYCKQIPCLILKILISVREKKKRDYPYRAELIIPTFPIFVFQTTSTLFNGWSNCLTGS